MQQANHLGEMLKTRLANKPVQLELDLRHICPLTAIPISATKGSGKAIYRYEGRMKLPAKDRWAPIDTNDDRDWVRHVENMYFHELFNS